MTHVRQVRKTDPTIAMNMVGSKPMIVSDCSGSRNGIQYTINNKLTAHTHTHTNTNVIIEFISSWKRLSNKEGLVEWLTAWLHNSGTESYNHGCTLEYG